MGIPASEIPIRFKTTAWLALLIFIVVLYFIAAVAASCTMGHYDLDYRKRTALSGAAGIATGAFILEYFKYRRVPGRVKWVKPFLYALIAFLAAYAIGYYAPDYVSCPLYKI